MSTASGPEQPLINPRGGLLRTSGPQRRLECGKRTNKGGLSMASGPMKEACVRQADPATQLMGKHRTRAGLSAASGPTCQNIPREASLGQAGPRRRLAQDKRTHVEGLVRASGPTISNTY